MILVDEIFIHCTDTPDTRNVSREEIRRWHIDRGFDDIGYHFIIDRDASLIAGRSLMREGAAVQGRNMNSISIVLVGRHRFTQDMLSLCMIFCARLVRKHGLQVKDVRGHYEVEDRKTCPNIDMTVFRAGVAAVLETIQEPAWVRSA